MLIINGLTDVRQLFGQGAISGSLAKQLVKKIKAFHVALEPDITLDDFSLTMHGQIGILEKGDRNMTALGLPEELDQIMPEWIGKLEVDKTVFYIIYTMTTNDEIIQIYLPDSTLDELLRDWLSEQTIEEEGDDYDIQSESF